MTSKSLFLQLFLVFDFYKIMYDAIIVICTCIFASVTNYIQNPLVKTVNKLFETKWLF